MAVWVLLLSCAAVLWGASSVASLLGNRTAFWIGTACFSPVIGFAAFRGPFHDDSRFGKFVALTILVPATGLVVMVAIVAMHAGAFSYTLAAKMLSRFNGKDWAVTAGFVVTTLLGGAFFYFRLKQRFLYGATEALAGGAVAAHRVSTDAAGSLPSETGFYFAILTAGVYLVVRGLDNMHQALRTGDPVVQWLRRRRFRLTVLLSGFESANPRANSGANSVRNERQ